MQRGPGVRRWRDALLTLLQCMGNVFHPHAANTILHMCNHAGQTGAAAGRLAEGKRRHENGAGCATGAEQRAHERAWRDECFR